MRWPRLLAIAVVAAAVLAACHGHNLPADEFRARANEVCARTAQQVAPLADLRRLEGDRLREVAGRLKSQARDVESSLKKVIPPGDLTPEYGRMIIHLSDVVEYLEELQDAAGTDDDRRPAVVLDKLRASMRKLADTARRVGLDQCAQAAARALPGARA